MNYNTIASQESISKTLNSLKDHGFTPLEVKDKEEALAKVKELIPAGVTLMNGTSETLHEIGFIDILKSKDHPWRNLHDEI